MSHAILHHRSLWSLDDLSSADVSALLASAFALKQAADEGRPERALRGRNIAVLYESSDDPALQRFMAAAHALGAQVAHVLPSRSGLSKPDTVRETAVMLGLLYDAIECDGLATATLHEVERDAGRPVFNGLATSQHPTRVLADLMTMCEHSGKPLSAIKLRYVGDARSPLGDAWLQSAALTGLDLCITSPPTQWPEPQRLQRAKRAARRSGARLQLVPPSPNDASAADFLCDESAPVRCPDGRPQLSCVATDKAEPDSVALGPSQVTNHHFTLQAMLRSTAI